MSRAISWAVDAAGNKTLYCVYCREVFDRKIGNFIDAVNAAERVSKTHDCEGRREYDRAPKTT